MRRCQQKCKPRLFYALESKKHLENKNDEDDDNDGYDAFVVHYHCESFVNHLWLWQVGCHFFVEVSIGIASSLQRRACCSQLLCKTFFFFMFQFFLLFYGYEACLIPLFFCLACSKFSYKLKPFIQFITSVDHNSKNTSFDTYCPLFPDIGEMTAFTGCIYTQQPFWLVHFAAEFSHLHLSPGEAFPILF